LTFKTTPVQYNHPNRLCFQIKLGRNTLSALEVVFTCPPTIHFLFDSLKNDCTGGPSEIKDTLLLKRVKGGAEIETQESRVLFKGIKDSANLQFSVPYTGQAAQMVWNSPEIFIFTDKLKF
jgi:hypothetical protein